MNDDDEDDFSDASVCSQMSTSSRVSVTQRAVGTRRSTRKVREPVLPVYCNMKCLSTRDRLM